MIIPEQYRSINNPFIEYLPAGRDGGYFIIPHPCLENHFLHCYAYNSRKWEHVAVTVRQQGKRSNRCPIWEEMCFAKSIFWEAEDTVIQYHPPESQYVDNHPFCLHLWRPGFFDIPVPPMSLVGDNRLNGAFRDAFKARD